MSSRRQLLESLLLSRLPSAFQEVEYIESAGTQYVDTQCIVNSSTKVKLESALSVAYTSQSQYACIIGTTGNSTSNPAFCIYVNTQYVGGRFGQYPSGTTASLFSLVEWGTNTKHYIECEINSLSVDNQTPITASMEYATLSNSLKLFVRGGYNSAVFNSDSYSKAKLYSCKIYDNDVLVRNFVPCYRKSDNEIGLYDLVNGVFYINAGTGTFTKGADV